jgi:hypothetical protein
MGSNVDMYAERKRRGKARKKRKLSEAIASPTLRMMEVIPKGYTLVRHTSHHWSLVKGDARVDYWPYIGKWKHTVSTMHEGDTDTFTSWLETQGYG